MTQDQMCGGNAHTDGWRDLGAIHSAAMTGMSSLPSRSQIYYIYGDSSTNTFSAEHVFTTPLLPGEATDGTGANLKALLFCDLGRGSTDDSETWDEYGRPAYNTSRFAAARANLGKNSLSLSLDHYLTVSLSTSCDDKQPHRSSFHPHTLPTTHALPML